MPGEALSQEAGTDSSGNASGSSPVLGEEGTSYIMTLQAIPSQLLSSHRDLDMQMALAGRCQSSKN